MEQVNKDQIIDNLNAQLISIDRLRDQAFKALHETQTALILKDKVIQDTATQISNLIKEKEELIDKLNELQNTIHCLGSEAQATEG